MVRRKHLEMFLQRLHTYRHPRLELEQYATTPELATSILLAIDDEVGLGDEGKLIADLGCGCGVLMLGATQFADNHFVLGIDIDEGALEVCRENVSDFAGAGTVDLLQADVRTFPAGQQPCIQGVFDLVVSNPPFGTKNNAGIDWSFVQAGISMLRPGGCLYSLHKSASRRVLLRKTKKAWPDDRVEVECVAELRWDLEKTYKHQKAPSLDIEVDLLRFRRLE